MINGGGIPDTLLSENFTRTVKIEAINKSPKIFLFLIDKIL